MLSRLNSKGLMMDKFLGDGGIFRNFGLVIGSGFSAIEYVKELPLAAVAVMPCAPKSLLWLLAKLR